MAEPLKPKASLPDPRSPIFRRPMPRKAKNTIVQDAENTLFANKEAHHHHVPWWLRGDNPTTVHTNPVSAKAEGLEPGVALVISVKTPPNPTLGTPFEDA